MIEHVIDISIVFGLAAAIVLLKRHRAELKRSGWYDA